jgi:hypothetical protein
MVLSSAPLAIPRQPRLDVPGIRHHVMVRGCGRRTVFRADADRAHVVAHVAAVAAEGAWPINASLGDSGGSATGRRGGGQRRGDVCTRVPPMWLGVHGHATREIARKHGARPEAECRLLHNTG